MLVARATLPLVLANAAWLEVSSNPIDDSLPIAHAILGLAPPLDWLALGLLALPTDDARLPFVEEAALAWLDDLAAAFLGLCSSEEALATIPPVPNGTPDPANVTSCNNSDNSGSERTANIMSRGCKRFPCRARIAADDTCNNSATKYSRTAAMWIGPLLDTRDFVCCLICLRMPVTLTVRPARLLMDTILTGEAGKKGSTEESEGKKGACLEE